LKRYLFRRSLSAKLLYKIALSFFISLGALWVLSNLFITKYIVDHREDITAVIYNLLVIGIYVLSIAIFSLIFLLLVNSEVKYIKYIGHQVKRISTKELGSTVEVRGNDELAELCKNINSMSIEVKNRFEKERKLEKIKTELIANVSHDLRTPLTSIIGYLDILLSEADKNGEEQKEYLNSTYSLSMKLKRLIDELFEYTKLSNSEIELEQTEIDICALINQLLGEYTPIFESKGLRIIPFIPEDKLIVNVDIEMIVRVFENILSNAEKYSIKPSDIVVRIENEGEAVSVSFSNYTENILQESIDKMFERFYRVDQSRSSKVPGSGLGLAIAKKIVELHHGEIFAESNGVKITFKVKLNLEI
jgi:signal transduction histidine kinase